MVVLGHHTRLHSEKKEEQTKNCSFFPSLLKVQFKESRNFGGFSESGCGTS